MRIGSFEIGRAKVTEPTVGEVAVAGSALPGVKFYQYNPDRLIGRKGFEIYDEMALDDAIKGPQMFFKYATLARHFTFKIDEEDENVEAQREFVHWAESMLDTALSGTWMDKLLALQTAHDYGFALSEKVYSPWEFEGKTTWALVDLKLKPFSSFKFETDDYGNVTGLVQELGGRVTKLPYDKFIHYVNRPDVNPQYGQSDLRACYRDWWAKDTVIKLWNIHLERHGSALPVASTNGQTDAQIEKLRELMTRGFGTGGAFIIPGGVQLTVHWPQNTSGFKDAIERCDASLSRALLMPSLMGMSEQGDTGSYSQAKVQQDTLEIYLDARAWRMADALNEQLWRYLALVNFGLENPPRYVPEPMTEAQKVAVLSLWADLLSKGAVKHNLDSENRCRDLLGFPDREEGDEPPPPVVQALPGQRTARQEPDSKVGEPVDEAPGEKQEMDRRGKRTEMSERTGRVDFASIRSWSDGEIERAQVDIGGVMNAIWENLSTQIERRKLGTRKANTPIEALEIPKALKSSLRRKIYEGLRRAWGLSMAEAQKEVKPRGDFVQQSGLTRVAGEEFLQTRAFIATRRLTEDLLTKVQTELANGLKFDKSTREVIVSLKPLIEDMIPAVDSAGRTVNKAARIETIVRTNWWEAINEARHSYFTDPALQGFVEAFEYSAILDDHTTEICESLDGTIYPADSPEWDELRPPNHFNCRSLLIPVTAIDTWEASPKTDVQPQEGFV